MNLPNKLTLCRLILTPIAIAVLFFDIIPYNFLIAMILFIIAMITDVLDGFIARKFHLITKLGTFLDPLADKLIILLFFIFLQNAGLYPLWLLIVFIGREMIVDSFRSFSISQNIYMGAIKSGKIKAWLQTISIILGLTYLSITHHGLFELQQNNNFLNLLIEIAYYSMIASLIVSIIGMFILVKNNRKVLKL